MFIRCTCRYGIVIFHSGRCACQHIRRAFGIDYASLLLHDPEGQVREILPGHAATVDQKLDQLDESAAMDFLTSIGAYPVISGPDPVTP